MCKYTPYSCNTPKGYPGSQSSHAKLDSCALTCWHEPLQYPFTIRGAVCYQLFHHTEPPRYQSINPSRKPPGQSDQIKKELVLDQSINSSRFPVFLSVLLEYWLFFYFFLLRVWVPIHMLHNKIAATPETLFVLRPNSMAEVGIPILGSRPAQTRGSTRPSEEKCHCQHSGPLG